MMDYKLYALDRKKENIKNLLYKIYGKYLE